MPTECSLANVSCILTTSFWVLFLGVRFVVQTIFSKWKMKSNCWAWSVVLVAANVLPATRGVGANATFIFAGRVLHNKTKENFGSSKNDQSQAEKKII
jgi:hypothetical protein